MNIRPLRNISSLGIRTQLILWYTVVFTMLILIFSLILYTTLQASLASGVDTELQLRTQQIAGGISSENGKIAIQDVTGELPSLDSSTAQGDPNETILANTHSDVNVGILVRVLDTNGRIIYISPAFRALTVPFSSITQPLKGVPWQGSITTHNGQTVRLYSTALFDNGKIFGVVQVGQSLAQLTSTLQSITIALLITAPLVLLLSAFGSYWLAKRAFRPIHRLTRTAREIKAGDLHQRVPVPRAKDEVQALALTLNEMIARLDLAFMQQRRFVADASHEMRTPVAVLRSITEVALSQTLNQEEYIAVLRDINAETERFGHLINDLLVLARVDENQITLDREPVRLDLLAFDVAATMEPIALERGINLQLERFEQATVYGDTARLILVMMGLLENALTYTPSGGTVTIKVAACGTIASFSVRDTGIGIAPEDIPHIFERFYRADPARSRAAGGSGLGLAIVDWAVKAHGGSIMVESHVGLGSTFTVTLPLATEHQNKHALQKTYKLR
jgi:two-component system OmpR family sensor kinase